MIFVLLYGKHVLDMQLGVILIDTVNGGKVINVEVVERRLKQFIVWVFCIEQS